MDGIGIWLGMISALAVAGLAGHALGRRSRVPMPPAPDQGEFASEVARAIVATAYDPYVAIDASSVILEWNLQAERTFGWTREEAIGRDMAEMIVPAHYRSAHRHGIRHYLATGEGRVLNQRIELSAMHRDGHEFPVEVTIWPTRIHGQLRFHAFLHDISARHRAMWRLTAQTVAAEALITSATLVEAAPRVLSSIGKALGWTAGGLWLADDDGALHCVQFWSVPGATVAGFERTSRGMSFDPGVGLPGRVLASGKATWIADVVGDDNFPRARIAAEEGLHAAFAFPIFNGPAVLGVVEFFSSTIEEPDQQLLAMMDTLGNLLGQFVARVRAEAALERKSEFLDAMLDNITDGIVACDGAGMLSVFNRATRELHGLPESPLPPEKWAEHYDLYLADGTTPMETAQIPLYRAFNGEQVRDVEMVIAPRDRPRRVVVCNGRALFDQTGAKLGAVVVMHEITGRKHVEQHR